MKEQNNSGYTCSFREIMLVDFPLKLFQKLVLNHQNQLHQIIEIYSLNFCVQSRVLNHAILGFLKKNKNN